MKTRRSWGMATRTVAAAIISAGITATSTAAPALLGRDLAGAAVAANDPSAVFLYSSAHDLTWLRNGGVLGLQSWDTQMAWASSLGELTVGSYLGGWMLPSVTEIIDLWREVGCQTASPTACYGLQDSGFLNIGGVPQTLWTSNEGGIANTSAMYFTNDFGYTFLSPKSRQWRALAVRAGDVLVGAQTVSEPPAIALAMLAIAGLWAFRRRRAWPGETRSSLDGDSGLKIACARNSFLRPSPSRCGV